MLVYIPSSPVVAHTLCIVGIIGAIVGGVAGGVVLLVLVAVLIAISFCMVLNYKATKGRKYEVFAINFMDILLVDYS